MYTVDGTCFIYYEDGTSGQWVEQSRNTVSASTYQSPNFLINGGFDIWQRGTSFTADGYCADRWYFNETGSCTVNQVTTGLPQGFNYALEADATTVSDSADLYQPLESSVVIPLRGRTVTFSCYLKMDSDMRSQSGAFELVADYSTSTDARASQTTVIGAATIDKSLYTDWARASYTFTVPSDAVGLMVGIEPPLTVSPTSATYFVTGAMLELGSTTTPFRTNAPNIQAELAACQRYYQFHDFIVGSGDSAGYKFATNPLGQLLRATPTITAATTGGPSQSPVYSVAGTNQAVLGKGAFYNGQGATAGAFVIFTNVIVNAEL
jgi:hypothetical protein